jgi:hypothetical protein
MLVAKPYILRKRHMANVAAGYAHINGESPSGRSHNSDATPLPTPDVTHGDHGHGEVFV